MVISRIFVLLIIFTSFLNAQKINIKINELEKILGEGKNYLLYNPFSLSCCEKGEIVVFDNGDSSFKVFNQELHFVTSFSRKGKGSGENSGDCFF